MKYLVVIIFIVISFFLGRASKNNNVQKSEVSSSNTRNFEMIEESYLELQKLKSLEEKYLQADELLGKVMLIYLAQVNLKLSPQLKSEISKKKITAKYDQKKSEHKSEIKKDKVKLFDENIGKDLYSKSTNLLGHNFGGLEKSEIKSIQNQVLKKPLESYEKAKAVYKEYNMLNGDLSGTLYFLSSEQVFSVFARINYSQSSNKLLGDFIFELTDSSGNVTSSNRGNGKNVAVKKLKDNSHLYIEVSPSSFVEVWPSDKNTVRYIGNYYSGGKHVGIIYLNKSN